MANIPPFDRKNKNPKFKALVAKLKKNPSVKDPEALAYVIGLRKMKGGGGGEAEGGEESGGTKRFSLPFWKRGWDKIKKGAKKIRSAFQADTYQDKGEGGSKGAKQSAKKESRFQATSTALEEMVEGFETLEG